MYACLGVTRLLHFCQNEQGLLRATAVTWGWNGHWIRVSTESSLWRRKFSRCSAGIRISNLSITSPALYQFAILTPQGCVVCLLCPEMHSADDRVLKKWLTVGADMWLRWLGVGSRELLMQAWLPGAAREFSSCQLQCRLFYSIHTAPECNHLPYHLRTG